MLRLWLGSGGGASGHTRRQQTNQKKTNATNIIPCHGMNQHAGAARGASKAEIKKKYFELAKKYHPVREALCYAFERLCVLCLLFRSPSGGGGRMHTHTHTSPFIVRRPDDAPFHSVMRRTRTRTTPRPPRSSWRSRRRTRCWATTRSGRCVLGVHSGSREDGAAVKGGLGGRRWTGIPPSLLRQDTGWRRRKETYIHTYTKQQTYDAYGHAAFDEAGGPGGPFGGEFPGSVFCPLWPETGVHPISSSHLGLFD